MVSINWNKFRAKFNGKETLEFENLSYQLFAKEHNKHQGIFRYKNQSGIETNPIIVGNDCIGFQAKFYECKISEKKSDIVKAIKKAKETTPNLTKLYFYLNIEFSEGKKENQKVSKYESEFNEVSKKLGLEVIWRVPSHFEIQLSQPENLYLAKYFFTLEKSAIDCIKHLNDHTENILYSIHNEIYFDGQKIKKDRSEEIEKINRALDENENIVLAGFGGSGKTALIKEIYEAYKDLHPFYLFKATELNVSDIDEIFGKLKGYNLNDFLEVHKEQKRKIIVIDSAEKFLDFGEIEVFKELLTILLKNSWKIIFTTRFNYLEDLEYILKEFYRLEYSSFLLQDLKDEELKKLSERYNFQLPKNSKVKNLIKNLFYLNEYLQTYENKGGMKSIKEFKDILWKKKIHAITSFKSREESRERERYFLNLISKRLISNEFYIKLDNINKSIFNGLEADEIIKYDFDHEAYFITHDIYEEWGIGKLVEKSFVKSAEVEGFFDSLGNSLIIRRGLRQWLSEKMAEDVSEISNLIEDSFLSSRLEGFWKDEVLVAVLLSDYSEEFFKEFKYKLMEGDFNLLKRVIFLLRVACKKNSKLLPGYLNTPYGRGWEVVIRFIHDNIECLPLVLLEHLIELLNDWIMENKKGKTTRFVSLIGIKLYERIQNDDLKYRYSEIEKKLIKIILSGSSEIDDELKSIIDNFLKFPKKSIYLDLCKEMVKSPLESNLIVTLAISIEIMKLCNYFWKETPKLDFFGGSSIGTEKYYHITEKFSFAYKVSSYETPIYWLLQVNPMETMTFILNFVNSAIENYAKSNWDKSLIGVEVKFNNKKSIKQYGSEGIWNIYRGTSSPRVPYLLQSIHMALEKYLLEVVKGLDKGTEGEKVIKIWLLELIIKSKSVSITSLVASVVMAYPDRFFDIAEILFKTKEFLLFDNIRKLKEIPAKHICSIGFNRGGIEELHRSTSLENLALNYQIFRKEGVGEEEAERQQKVIWGIIDGYYSELEKNQFKEENITFKFILARIDKRRMDIKTEAHEDGILIHLDPELSDELKESSSVLKYNELKLWSSYKNEGNEKYTGYKKYEENPRLAFEEMKVLIKDLEDSKAQRRLLYKSTPSEVSAILLRDYLEVLEKEEQNFCRDILLGYIEFAFNENYSYQIGDGVSIAINSIPRICKLYPELVEELSLILLLNLIKGASSDLNVLYQDVVCNLWEISRANAIRILLGYLEYKPLYDELSSELYNSLGYSLNRNEISKKFIEKYDENLKKIFTYNSDISRVKIEEQDIERSEKVFKLIPVNTKDKDLLEIIKKILPTLCKEFFKEEPNSRHENYELKKSFLKRYSDFILNREVHEVEVFTKPFIEEFKVCEYTAGVFVDIIGAQDRLNRYEQFWKIWDNFYSVILDVSLNDRSHYKKDIIYNYLLAYRWWSESARDWHTLKKRDKEFFRKVSKEMKPSPDVLYSFARVLDSIGSNFLNDGIIWINEIIKRNPNLINEELEVNTVYYLDNITKKYVYKNKSKIKKNLKLKKDTIVILDFLVEKASSSAYLLRESIL